MIRLEKDSILLAHQMIVQQSGGSLELRDEGLLDSAIASPYAGFGEVEFYPSKEEKAARLGFSLISNHPFVDGNKRIGCHAMLMFLVLNGIDIDYSEDELVSLGFGIADNSIEYEDILQWIHDHKI